MSDDLFPDFIDMINNRFSDLDDAIINALPEKDERYAELMSRERGLKDQFPNIDNWLEGNGSLSLTAEEHAGMVEYIEINAEKEGIERLAIYFGGHKDCFAYLKRIGAI